jgi:hypothetical protein
MKDSKKYVERILLAIAVTGWMLPEIVMAHEGHSSSSPPPPRTGRVGPERSRVQSEAVAPALQAPHRGQLYRSNSVLFEVVYAPRETRIYFFDSTGKPFTARSSSGEVIMQVVGNPQYFRNRLHYVAQPEGSAEQDYLAAQIDVTRIRDGDMRVFFDMRNLPSPQEQSVRFGQVFALTSGPPAVIVAQFTEADRPAAVRQAICPVMETGFDHGDPIKLLVGNQVIYVCCEECIETIKKNPEAYLARAAPYDAARYEAQRVPVSSLGREPRCSKGCCNK